MAKPELVLCRGWRRVSAYVLRSLRERAERDPLALTRALVLVPTSAAAHLFGAQLEGALLDRRKATVVPAIATVPSLLAELARRSAGRVRLADPLLREALLERAFQTAIDRGASPPFALRGSLAARVLEFYDELCSKSFEVLSPRFEAFAARTLEELDAPGDEGAESMAAQTRFLQASLAAYERALESAGLVDPPALREALRHEPFPYEWVFIVGAETASPADLAFFSSVQGVAKLVVAVGESRSALPEALRRSLAEVRTFDRDEADSPRLVTPSAPKELAFAARDREEALLDVARLLKLLHDRNRLPPLERVAIVVPRPLPYLYLAKKVFGEAGIPYELQDSFPLATEPYMAAVDLALELVESDAHRTAALALLRSPFFQFPGVDLSEVAAFDELTVRYRVVGGLGRWRFLYERQSRPPVQPALPGMEDRENGRRGLSALAAILEASASLSPLSGRSSLTGKIDCLRRFLDRYGRTLSSLAPREDASRLRRTRAAFDSILERLASAARAVSDPPVDFHDFREKLRRAIESHTFAVRAGEGGVSIVDARSAGFGAFDLVVFVGLNDGEWPARGERNIFYPPWLLREFGWPSDRDLLARERHAFRNLLELARERVFVFRHQLEDEVPTIASPLLEEVESWVDGQPEMREPLAAELPEILVTRSELLRRGAAQPERSVPRERRAGIVGARLPVSEPISPTAFELYLRCPFKYLSRYLLGLEEEEDVDDALTPLAWGRILHELLQEAFAEWDRGREAPRPIDAGNYEEALALFRRIAIEKIPREHRRVELHRLFGGAGEPGYIPWLLRQEMARGPLQRRLVEHAFQSALRLERGPSGESPWFVRIKGRVDRADLDAEGQLHVFDYKSGRAPDARVTMQVPLYAMCLSQELGAPVREAAYLSFRDRKSTSRADFDRSSARLVAAYRAIREGRFAPRPYKDRLCRSCGFVGLCRKEIDEREPAPIEEVE